MENLRGTTICAVMRDGKIAEQGRHEELMKQEGIYKRFVESRELAASWKL